MLIAVIGPQKSGKQLVRDFLVREYAFRYIAVAPTSANSTSAHRQEVQTYPTEGALLDYATINWSSNILIADDFCSYKELDSFRKRPFFLLISVTAPVMTRLQRQWDWPSSSREDIERFLIDENALFNALPADRSGDQKASQGMTRHDSDGVIASLSNLQVSSRTPPDPHKQSISNTSNSAKLMANAKPAGIPVRHRLTTSELMSSADLRLCNDFHDKSSFESYLKTLDLSSHHRLRPAWDTYFVSLCTLASLRSNCMKRRVGAVLVRDNRVLSTGYNGTPRGLKNCNEGGCPRCNGTQTSTHDGAEANGVPLAAQSPLKCGVGLDECLCLHAEENALLECGRERGGAEGTVLYCNTCPCLRCAVKIVQTGVKEVVYQLEYSMDDRSREIFNEAGVVFRKYLPPI